MYSTSTCLHTRKSSPCQLHACSKSLLAAVIGQQAVTTKTGAAKKKECLYHSLDRLLLSFFPLHLIQLPSHLCVCSCHLGLGSWADQALRTDLDQDDGLGDRQPMNDRGMRAMPGLLLCAGSTATAQREQSIIIIVRLTLLRSLKSIDD